MASYDLLPLIFIPRACCKSCLPLPCESVGEATSPIRKLRLKWASCTGVGGRARASAHSRNGMRTRVRNGKPQLDGYSLRLVAMRAFSQTREALTRKLRNLRLLL